MIDVTFSIPARDRDNLEINYAARLATCAVLCDLLGDGVIAGRQFSATLSIEEAGKIGEAIRLIKARLNVDEVHLTYDGHGNLWA